MGGTEYEKKSFKVDMGVKAPEMSGEEIQKIADERMREARNDAIKQEDEELKKYREGLDALLSSCPFDPLNDRVLVYPERVGLYDKKTKSGIIVIDSIKKNAKKATNKGVVLAVGPGLTLVTGEVIKPSCSKGDVVMYEQFGYSEVYIGDSLCHVCRAGDLLGKASRDSSERLAGF